MQIDLNDCKRVNLSDLNCFEQLVHLELEGLALVKGELSLRNLKIAYFENMNEDTVKFGLDCPQLEALGIGCLTEPRLTSRTCHSVKHLYVNHACESKTYLLRLYSKLKSLFSICFSGSGDLGSFVLAAWERRISVPSLKEIKLKELGGFPDQLLWSLEELKSIQETKHIAIRINWKVMDRNEPAEIFNLLDNFFPDQESQWHSFNKNFL